MLFREHVLPEVRAGRPVSYRPPGWVAHEREGAVELPGGLEVLVLEGVGASQPSLLDLVDLVLWVETDEPTRLARDVVRVHQGGEMSLDDYASWMAEENAYVTASRPWENAAFVVNGSGLPAHDPVPRSSSPTSSVDLQRGLATWLKPCRARAVGLSRERERPLLTVADLPWSARVSCGQLTCAHRREQRHAGRPMHPADEKRLDAQTPQGRPRMVDPEVCVLSGDVLVSHTVPRAVPSALKGLTSGFGMGPGVSLTL